MKRSRSRIAAVAGFVGIFPALVLVALLAFEFSVPADGFRARVGSALSDALGCPLTIAGSLHVLTGTQPGLEGRDVRLAECRRIRVARASAAAVRVRVNLWALFSREIDLVEIAGERLEAEVPTGPPAAVSAAAPGGPPSRWTFTGITRLYVAPARVLVRSANAAPRSIDLMEVEGSAQAGRPMRLTVRGTHGAEAWSVSGATATLREALVGPDRWPLDLAVAFAGADATLRGSWTPAPLDLKANLTLKTPEAERLVKAAGGDPPELGALDLTGSLSASPERISLGGMRFAGPVGTIAGDVRVALPDGRPKVDVRLSADELDYAALDRWRSAGRGSGSLEEFATHLFARLRSFDGALTATVKQVTSLPFPAGEASYSARLEAGRLNVAASATVDGAPGEAALEVDARGPFAIDARVSVKALPRAAVAHARGVATLDPRIGGLHATLSARSATVAGLFEDLRVGVTGSNVRFAVPLPDDPVEARLRSFELRGQSGKPLHANAVGTFAGEPLEFAFTGAPAAELLQNRTWEVERARARIGAALLDARGRIEPVRDTRKAWFTFDLSVSRLDRLAPFVPGTSLPGVPGSVRGTIEVEPDAWKIDATALAVGATRGSGTASARRGAPLEVALDLDRVAIDELAAAKETAPPRGKDDVARAPPDMDLSLNARSAAYGEERFETVAAKVRVRDGAARAPFSLNWAAARVEGTLAARFDKGSLQVEGDATANGLDVARLPGSLGKQGVTGRIERVTARIKAVGPAPAALPANAAIALDIANATLALPSSDTLPSGALLWFGGALHAAASEPIDFSFNGTYRDKAFAATGRLPPLDALYPAGKPHAVRLAIDYDQTRLAAAGDATIDRDRPHFSGSLSLSGDTLHVLAELAGFSTPRLGPYKVSATVEASRDRITTRDLTLQLGKSSFRASLSADMRQVQPKVAASMSGRPVHLEDIGAQSLNPGNLERRAADEKAAAETIDQARLDRDARMLTRLLRSHDFDLDVTFDEVSAAGEKVGRAELKAALAGGRLRVDPATLWIGQGKFSAEIGIDVSGKTPQYAVKFEGTGFDYGPFMRAMDPKSPYRGTLDLSMDIRTSGAPEALAQNASGALDVLVLPEDQAAGALGVLGSGVMRLLLRTLDPRSQSQLNCIVAGFNLDSGVATSQIVLLDTTLARVAGDLVVDYRSRTLNGRFAPRSKQPQLFSVVPGIIVDGTLEAPDIKVSAQSVVLGALRIWQFPVTFASDWLTKESIPADGTPDCRAAYRHVLH